MRAWQAGRLAAVEWRVFCVVSKPRNRNPQPTTCNLQPATCNLQPATCNLQPATRNLQPATPLLQHTRGNRGQEIAVPEELLSDQGPIGRNHHV
ncbi:MAG: hypothetical protein EHM18_03915, partial [Acidobacteria bacterium]